MSENVVTSKDNPLVKLAVSLLSSKKAREQSGLFVAEGLRLCLDAAVSGVAIRTLLVDITSRGAGDSILKALAEKGLSVVPISGAAAARLGDTKTPQGVYAICEKLDNRQCAVTIKRSGHFLLLENIQDPGNLGAMLRTADAMGVGGVYLGPGCVDRYSPKVLRASMGGLFRLALEEVESLPEAALRLIEAGVPVWAAALNPNARRAGEVDFSQGGAVVIGNEGAGLTAEMVAACTGCLYIPMVDGANSLNAAVAAGILLWEMHRSEAFGQRPEKGG